MNERICADRQGRVIRTLVFLLAVYAFGVLFDPFFFDYRPLVLPLRQLYGCLLAAGLLYVCVRLKYVGVLLYLIVCVCAAVWFYAYKVFGYLVGFELVSAVLETNRYELAGFFNGTFFLALVGYVLAISVIFAAAVYSLGWRKLTRCRVASIVCVLLLWGGVYEVPPFTIGVRHGLYMKLCDETLRSNKELLFGAGMVNARIAYNRWRLPYSNFGAVWDGVREYYADLPLVRSEDYESADCRQGEPLVCMLVIGESVRGDHVPAGGYGRNTMPKCSAEKNVCFYSRMYSFASVTYHSIKGIMAGMVNEQQPMIRTSFASILKKHGFATRWYSENTENIISSRLMASVFGYSMGGCRAWRMPIENVAGAILEELRSLNNERQLLIVENGTGHYPYANEDKYDVFVPCNVDFFGGGNDDGGERMINDYDNCIVAVDSFLFRLIDGLRHRNAVLLYVSDHGELLGENGRFMHGGHEDEVARHVASFIWFSDEYERRHPGVVAEMKSVKDKLLVHGQIYATILKLCGIDSKVPLDIGDFANGDVRSVEHNLPKSMNLPSSAGVK